VVFQKFNECLDNLQETKDLIEVLRMHPEIAQMHDADLWRGLIRDFFDTRKVWITLLDGHAVDHESLFQEFMLRISINAKWSKEWAPVANLSASGLRGSIDLGLFKLHVFEEDEEPSNGSESGIWCEAWHEGRLLIERESGVVNRKQIRIEGRIPIKRQESKPTDKSAQEKSE
jgi:hypothetical protein